MIGNLSHVTIVIPDLALAIQQYEKAFGAFVTTPRDLLEHGVQTAIVKLPNTTLELITPLGENSPIRSFLEKNALGGVHHLCYEVKDLIAARDHLISEGIRAMGNGIPRPGYRGHPVLFFDLRDRLGMLIELEETPSSQQVQERVDIKPIGPASVHTSHHPSTGSLEGVEGVGIGIEVDFRRTTPKDNEEGD